MTPESAVTPGAPARPTPARARRRRGGTSGQASVMLVGALVAALAFVGLAADGTRMLLARRDLQSLADAAALAGASAIDEAAYRDTAGAVVQLDPRQARADAAALLVAAPVPAGTRVDIAAAPDAVTVTLQWRVEVVFLRLVGLGPQPIGARARAAPVAG